MCSVRFPVVRRGTGVCLSVFWVAAAVSAGVRCGIRASEALFCRERENLLGTSADGSASHRSGAGCLRVGCADGSCLIVDSMAVVIYESAPVVVAGCDQVLFWVVNLPVVEGLFQKQVRLHPKIIVFKIQCIIKFATIVIYDHLMRQSGLKYRTLGWYRLHTGILPSFDAAVFVFSPALLPAQTFADLRFS